MFTYVPLCNSNCHVQTLTTAGYINLWRSKCISFVHIDTKFLLYIKFKYLSNSGKCYQTPVFKVLKVSQTIHSNCLKKDSLFTFLTETNRDKHLQTFLSTLYR